MLWRHLLFAGRFKADNSLSNWDSLPDLKCSESGGGEGREEGERAHRGEGERAHRGEKGYSLLSWALARRGERERGEGRGKRGESTQRGRRERAHRGEKGYSAALLGAGADDQGLALGAGAGLGRHRDLALLRALWARWSWAARALVWREVDIVAEAISGGCVLNERGAVYWRREEEEAGEDKVCEERWVGVMWSKRASEAEDKQLNEYTTGAEWRYIPGSWPG